MVRGPADSHAQNPQNPKNQFYIESPLFENRSF
jgi:hypothetical protein